MDTNTVESAEKRQGAIFQPNIPVIIYTTAIVVLAGSILIPLWWKYDPILGILDQVQKIREVGKENGQDVLMTKSELAKYSAKASSGKLYLAMLGKVYDVTVGKQHYGKDGSYSFFTGISLTGSTALFSLSCVEERPWWPVQIPNKGVEKKEKG